MDGSDPPFQAAPLSAVEEALSDMLRQPSDLGKRISNTIAFIDANRPINRLPFELLVTIFRLVHEDLDKHQYTDSYVDCVGRSPPWYPMVAVCRHWRSVVCATPMLWCLVQIGPKTTAHCLDLVLSRSKDLPIAVNVYSLPNVVPFGEVLVRHRARITSFHVQGVTRAPSSFIHNFVQASMPNLRTLSMWFDPFLVDPTTEEDEDDLPIDEQEVFMFGISRHRHPELQELSLRGIGLQGTLPYGSRDRPPNLTHLELRDSNDPDCDLPEFVLFLGACRHLQTLTLVRFRPYDEDFDTIIIPDALNPLPIVELAPTLRSLFIEDIDAYIARLLTGLVVPATTDLSFTKLITPRDTGEVREAWELLEHGFLTVLPERKSGLPLFSLVTGVHLALSDSSACLIADAGQHSMTITIKVVPDGSFDVSPDVEGDIEQLAAANDSITELTIANVGDLRIWREPLKTTLLHLPQLRTLTALTVEPPLESDSSLEVELLKSIVQTIEQPDTGEACLALEELNVNCLHPRHYELLLENLALLLRHRNSQGTPLRRVRIELAGRGYNPSLSAEERAAREGRFLEALGPLVDVVECAHHTLVECDLEAFP
ncbi:hypothetical protein L226DRAFT_257850 [Lentinus tigrinus ALCF2SS1-7]|uniref:uncharacterized protein n=1 Tax=Lentinus tigrinus ALCF2SS1-7 TaxID=1328758 RepID=UPI00116636B9|nr:hypothetical protein L226DRAFT_257850 [Lentinus tigrinus ALCF2SS1-7]